jgi:mono/diheme cytochrome c family protein
MQGHAIVFAALTLGSVAVASAQPVDAGAPGSIERGRYIARIAGCNDCHTPGYSQSGGATPESRWLTGDRLGWKGPWGTTYPANVRIAIAKMSEQEWVQFARTAKLRPPMPWFALRDMATDDLLALHRFVRQLGPVGEPAPAYLPPSQAPQGPVISFP